jgi:manganese efflux pump family protein
VSDTGFVSILIIAIGLSADCFAVALSASISRMTLAVWQGIRVSVFFGVFQAVMTWLGWWAGSYLLEYIQSFDHWVAFGLLVFIGAKMIWESLHEKEERSDITRWRYLFLLAIATSLDALAAGLSFAFLQVNILSAGATIGVTAFVITFIGFLAGKKVGELAGKRAEIVGGLILIGIGLKILLEHLLG